MLSQLEHLGVNLQVLHVSEILPRIPDLVGIAQRSAQEPLLPGLNHDDALPFRQHDTTKGRHALVTHGFAHYREGVLPRLIVRRDIIRTVEIALVYLLARNEGVDLYRVAAFDRDGVEFVIFDG